MIVPGGMYLFWEFLGSHSGRGSRSSVKNKTNEIEMHNGNKLSLIDYLLDITYIFSLTCYYL